MKASQSRISCFITALFILAMPQMGFSFGMDPLSIIRMTGGRFLVVTSEDQRNCSDSFQYILNDNSSLMLQMFIASGKAINDLGNYDQCNSFKELRYSLVSIRSSSDFGLLVQMGLCVPAICESSSLSILDNIYKESVRITGMISDPMEPQYTFPKADYQQMYENLHFGFYLMMIIIIAIISLSIVGYFIQTKHFGDKTNTSSMVETVEEDQPNEVSIEAKKKRWAIIIYSFSITRNFQEIFFRPARTIKDKKFEVFNGLRFLMMIWIVLGHCYIMTLELGNATSYLKQEAIDTFFSQVIVSSDFPISFFYFMSAFIGMFGLIKKYQKQNNDIQEINSSYHSNSCESISTPKITKRALLRLVIGRWIRLSLPTYLLILFSMTIFEYLGSGPTFTYNNKFILQNTLKDYWWTIILFIQNWIPWTEMPGLYWLHYISNDLWFYIFVMMPSIYLYQCLKRRKTVLIFNILLIVQSITYLLTITWYNEFSALLHISDNSKMLNLLYRRPFGPIGYYAFGIIIAIFYFEYSQANADRSLRTRYAYRFIESVGKTRKSSIITQSIGGFMVFFLVFIRYSSFAYQSTDDGFQMNGRWPNQLNALFNGFAHYLFICGFILMFIPVFMGKLSLLRDIFSLPVFRPLARITFSAFLIQGLGLLLMLFSTEQAIFFDHKNVLFIYFTLIVNSYVIGFFVALLCEYPFRTISRTIFSPPKRIIRLNAELAKELNTNFEENMLSEIEEAEDLQVEDQRKTSDFNLPSEGGESMKRKKEKKYQSRLTKISESQEEYIDRRPTFNRDKKDD